MAPVADILHRQYLGNPLSVWLTAATTAAILFAVLLLLRYVLVARIGAIAARTANRVDDLVVALIGETRAWVLLAISVYVATSPVRLPPRLASYLEPTAKLVLLWQIASWGAGAISFWVKHHLEHRTTMTDRAGVAMINAIGVGAKVLLWILVIVTTLKSVFGIEITPLITGLGVSGIAIALAVQNILGDLLAALAIVFDKPFDVGDTIGVDQITGTVEHIGLKTTRIRSITGEQIIIGNGDLLKSRLRNYRRMYQRRVAFTLDVTFDTPPAVLAKLPGMLERIVSAQNPVKFDRSHVSTFNDSAVRVETVYYVLDADYKKYMDVQQAINLEILSRFAAERVRFAFPTRTVHVEGGAAWGGLRSSPDTSAGSTVAP